MRNDHEDNRNSEDGTMIDLQTELQETGTMLTGVVLHLQSRAADMLTQTSWIGYLVSIAAAVVSAVWHDLFGFVAIMWTITMMGDWLLGRWLAHRAGDFSQRRAVEGIVSKATGFGVILVFWGLEMRLMEQVTWYAGEGGLVSTVILVLFLLDELDSVEQNRLALGGSPIPMWTQAIAYMRGAAARFMPEAEEEQGAAAVTEDPE